MFLNCPAYMDNDGATRCGLPAEVQYRYTLESTDGPLESAKIRCLVGHWFNAPIASLTWECPAKQRQQSRRPNSAPAYYLGHPASVWAAAMRPRRRRTASHRLVLAAALHAPE